MLPFGEESTKVSSCDNALNWGVSSQLLSKYARELEMIFSLDSGTYEAPEHNFGSADQWLGRMPKWPTFQNRATSNLFRKKIETSECITVLLDATVTKILESEARIKGVEVEAVDGPRVSIETDQLLICAGAIETTRLLLHHVDSQARSYECREHIGRYFHDHLSGVIADLEIKQPEKFMRLFSFQFRRRGQLRNLRFERSTQSTAKSNVVPGFIHVSFDREGESGFDGLRGVFQAIQQRQTPALSDIRLIAADWRWFLKAIWFRFVRKSLLPPPNAKFQMHLVTQQCPYQNNEISLSSEQRDVFGIPLAAVTWSISDKDKEDFATPRRALLMRGVNQT